MKTDYANAPTPTLFQLFLTSADEAEAIEQKRYVRRVCEAVGASIGRTVRFKTSNDAGQTIENGAVVNVAGFNIFAQCSDEGQTYAEDKRALMNDWWTPAGYTTVGVNRVLKQKAHSPGYELEFGSDIQAFVENDLGHTFVEPQVWADRAAKAEAKAQREAEAAKRKEERAAKKAAKLLADAKAAQAKADAAAAQAESTDEASTEEPVAEAA